MNEVFSPTLILAPLAGLGVGFGLVLLTASLVGWPRRRGRTGPSAAERLTAFLRRRAAAAITAGLIVLAFSHWLVAAIGAGLIVLFWRQVFGGAGEERAALARVEALAAWTESLRDTIAGAAGLEQAIGASARSSAPVLRPLLVALNDRLRTRMPLTQALDQLAAELSDGGADQVIAALKQSAGLRGAGLRDVLGALAVNSRAEVDMRRRIYASRAGTRRSVQIVVTVVVLFIGGMMIFNPVYTAPYGSWQGQGVLAIVLACFAAGFAWLRKLSAIPTPERFLVKAEAEANS